MFILWTCLAFALAVISGLAWEDWFHLTRPAQMVMGRVVGHKHHTDEGSRNYAAILEFRGSDGQPVTVEDNLFSAMPKPAIGSMMTLHYPEGLPKKARVRRPILRTIIYLSIFYLTAVLVGRLTGHLSASGDITGL